MRIFIVVLIAILNLTATEFEIEKLIDENSLKLKNCEDLRVNQSGFVIDSKFKVILANATLVDSSSCIINLSEFKALNQLALAKITEEIELKDRVVFDSNLNRAVIIAPNQSSYQEFKELNQDRVYTHPDIFNTYLSSINNPSPTKEDFKTLCRNFSISELFFLIEDRSYRVDCISMAIIDSTNFEIDSSEEIVPFYSRLKDVDTSIFSFKSEVESYSEYYRELLGL